MLGWMTFAGLGELGRAGQVVALFLTCALCIASWILLQHTLLSGHNFASPIPALLANPPHIWFELCASTEFDDTYVDDFLTVH